MIPAWKLKRELNRLGQQLRGIPERVTDPIRARRLDRAVTAGLPRFDGALPAADKIALYLLYQPKGVAPSTVETCRWLAEHGYAPFIVSNAPLAESDRTALAPVIWRAVERPNFGYDFGGYRDGLTSLRQWGIAPETLLILNDSIWIPILPDTDILERLEAHPADIAGTILRERGHERFLESYLYRISHRALMHPAFARFWADLKLTSNKYHVIRRGERGFSAAMRAAGLTLAGLYDTASLPEALAQQDDAFLRKMLAYGAYIDAPFASERDRLLTAAGPEWRNDVLIHVREVLSKRPGYSSFPYATVALCRYPVLKKSHEPISRAWREAFVNALIDGQVLAATSYAVREAIQSVTGQTSFKPSEEF